MKFLPLLPPVTVALLLVACRNPAPLPAGPDAATIAPSCTDPIIVHALIDGTYAGDATSESVGRPSLIVALDVHHSPYPLRNPSVKRAVVTLAPPRFALPFAAEDLCSVHLIPNSAVFSCIGDDGNVHRLQAQTSNSSATLTLDGSNIATEAMPPDGNCLHVETTLVEQDIERMRAAFNRDEPSARCAGTPVGAPLAGVVALRALRKNDPRALERSSDETPAAMTCESRKELTLSIPQANIALALGTIDNVCGGCTAQREDRTGALTLSCSDMGTEYRHFYQLGDGLFVNDGAKFRRIDLPCGRKLTLAAKGRDFASAH